MEISQLQHTTEVDFNYIKSLFLFVIQYYVCWAKVGRAVRLRFRDSMIIRFVVEVQRSFPRYL